MDVVLVSELRCETVIGVHTWERRLSQVLVLDLELAVDAAAAAAADSITAALDYQAVADRVRAHVAGLQAQLVETVAESVAGLLRDELGVPWVRVTVRKPGALAGAKGVAVRLERGQAPAS